MLFIDNNCCAVLTVVEPAGGRGGYAVPVDENRGRARFSARYAAAALFLGPVVVEDLDRSRLLSAGHADDGDGAVWRDGINFIDSYAVYYYC